MKTSLAAAFHVTLLLFAGAPAMRSQSFRIESFQLDSQFRPSLSVPAETNSYFRLLGGQEIISSKTVLALSFSNTIVAPQPVTNRQGFYRVQQVPLASPVDSDGDGIDDVWELEHSLDPLLASDAAQIAPGDTRNWLELYMAEKAVTFAYQYPPDQPTYGGAYGEGLAQDPISKAIYASGRTLRDGVYRALILKSTNGGITWSTNAPILDLDYAVPLGLAPVLCVDSSGNIYAIPNAGVLNFVNKEMTVLKSSDGGTNWSLVDDYPGEPDWGPPVQGVKPSAVAADRNGNVYAVGRGVGSVNNSVTFYWFVRKFTAASNAWATVDGFHNDEGTEPRAVVCDPTGGVFVAGSDSYSWVVRHSGDGGLTWQTVSTYQPYANQSGATRIAADAKGNIYVCGNAREPNGTYHWIVRASSDGGLSWRTIDNISGATPRGITVEGGGRLSVIGGVGQRPWVLRQSSDGGTTWVNADDFAYGEGGPGPNGILALSDGSVLATGEGYRRTGAGSSLSSNWVFRRLPPPPPQ